MVRTPLMLSIVTLAYHGQAVQALPSTSPSPAPFQKAAASLRTAYSKLLEAKPATTESRQALADLHTASGHLFSVGRFAARRRQVFAAYVQRMLSHRGSERRYTSEQTIHW